MKQPPFPTKEDVVQGWIDLCKTEQNTDGHEEAFWVHMFMLDLGTEFPMETFDVIKLVLERDDSDAVVGITAAGPIEDLLVEHGPELIDQIEAEAKKNPKFNHALGGVWQSSSLPEVWERIEAVRDSVW